MKIKSSVLDMVKELRGNGHRVSVYKRKDGGYLITRIDSARYKGAKGNNVARMITHRNLSDNTREVLKELQESQKKFYAHYTKQKLPEEFMKKLKETQRIWRSAKLKVEGRIRLTKYRAKLEHEGLESVMQSLTEKQRYAKGLAYNENINSFIADLENRMSHSSEIHKAQGQKIIDYLNKNRDKITEKQIAKAFEMIYRSEKGDNVSFDTGLKQVASIFDINLNDL